MQLLKNKHIIDQYDKEFEYIINELKRMCLLTEQQLQDALTAIENKDTRLAGEVIKKDKIINEIQVNIQDNCSFIIMKLQPTASDLRLIFSIFLVIFEIERIADVARRFAGLTLPKYPDAFKPILKLLEKIASLSLDIFNQTANAFMEMDLNEATRLYPNHKDLLELTKITEEQIIKAIHEHKIDAKQGINLFNTVRSLAKIDSRCQNICELIIYYHLGENVKYKSKNTIVNLINEGIKTKIKVN